MTTEEHLEKIVAKCRENLTAVDYMEQIKRLANPLSPLDRATFGNEVYKSHFYQSSKAGWRATIAAIEMADKLDSVHEANDIRCAIIAAWPEELL